MPTGNLELGSTTTYYNPQTVNLGAGRSAVSVSAGQHHTCAILDDGSLKCWGYNFYGQIGNRSTETKYSPQTVNIGTGRTATSVWQDSTKLVPFLMMEV